MKKIIIYLTVAVALLGQPGLLLAAENAAVKAAPESSAKTADSFSADAPDKDAAKINLALPAAAEKPADSATIDILPETKVNTPINNPTVFEPLINDKDQVNQPNPLDELDEGEGGAYNQEKSADNSAKKIAGLTGNLRVDQFSGAASYNLGLDIPAGRNGMQPSLNLFYNSHDRSNDSWVGQGWNLDFGYIQRSTKHGTNNLYNSNEFTLSLGGSSAELIEVDEAGHLYAPKEESNYLKIQYVPESSSWLITDNMGVKYYFGQTAVSRQDDPADQARIYKWRLDRVEDTNGNYYSLDYHKENGAIYPFHIYYTGHGEADGPMEIDFILEERGQDNATSYQSQFLVTTNKRLNSIEIRVDNELTGKYDLNYIAGQNNVTSLLSSITKKGYQNNEEFSLPATTFTYQEKGADWTDVSDEWQGMDLFNENNNDPRYEGKQYFEDFNGDSWIDRGNKFHTGTGWVNSDWIFPGIGDDDGINERSVFRNSVIGDVNGDNYPDIISSLSRVDSGKAQIYINNKTNGFYLSEDWSTALPELMQVGNREDFNFAKIGLIDVNNDGLDDIIYAQATEDGNHQWSQDRAVYLNTGSGWEEGYGSFPAILSTYFTGNQWALDDFQKVNTSLMDFNGDGLVDIFTTRGFNINGVNFSAGIYLNTGNSWEQQPSQIWTIPQFNNIYNWPVSILYGNVIRFTDLNGDGLLDVVLSGIFRDNQRQFFNLREVRVNNGHGWERDDNFSIPEYFARDEINTWQSFAVMLMDINNDGAMDVVRADCDFNGQHCRPVKQVHLSDAASPNLLSSISNGYGAQTSLEYQTSAQYFNQDGTFKNPKLPLNLQTVKSITTNDGSGNEITTDYDYQDGYYSVDPLDYAKNQFTGFGLVTSKTGDQVIKTYYHQGAGIDGYALGEYDDTMAKKGRVYREEVYQDNNGELNLRSAKISTWKEQPLDNGRTFVYLDGTVAYDYSAGGEQGIMALGMNNTAQDQEANQQALAASEQASVLNVDDLQALQSLQNFQPQTEPQLFSESADGLTKTYYLGKSMNGGQLFRSEIYIQPRPELDEAVEEDFEVMESDGEMQHSDHRMRRDCNDWMQVVNAEDADRYITNDEIMELTNSRSLYQGTVLCSLSRIFLPFNTSAIPDEAIVISAELDLSLMGGNSAAFITGMDTDEPWMEQDRYGQVLDTVLASGSLVYNNPMNLVFNNNGRDYVNKEGYTILALRGNYDFRAEELYNGPDDYFDSEVRFYGSEAQGTENDPYLIVEYTLNHPPLIPGDLQVEGQANPDDITEQRPNFTAIYNDDNEDDRAVVYQLQVIREGGNFEYPLLDTRNQDMEPTESGQRISAIEFAGRDWEGADVEPLLLDGMKYFWRIKFWDDEGENGTEGDWSQAATFSMFNENDVLTGIKAKAVKIHYDFSTGNVISEDNYGEVKTADNGVFLNTDLAIMGDEKTTSYEYAEALNQTDHILSAPKQKVLINPNTNEQSTVQLYYDDLDYGRVEKANQTKEDLIIGQTEYQKDFNNYGLVTQTTDPLGHTASVAYDADNYYPISTTNHLNQTVQTEYDLATGQIKRTIDPNGNIEERDYDAFGRVTEIRKTDPQNPQSFLVMATYEYHDTDQPSWTKQSVRIDVDNWQDSYTYFDGLGRTIQTRQENLNNQFIAVSYEYDNKGNLARQSIPYPQDVSAYTEPTWQLNTQPYTAYVYDAQNRVLTETFNSSTDTWTTSYEYDGWNVLVTDANNNQKNLYKDAYGQLIQVDEYLDNQTYSTNYTYNLLGKLTNITDSQNNTRNFEYDELGRLISQEEMHNPTTGHFGVWTYAYNDASNLIRKTDPKGQTVEYAYDPLNRIVAEDYTGEAGLETVYIYDQGANGLGRLSEVLFNPATADRRSFSYDLWGRAIREAGQLNGQVYQTDYAYTLTSQPLTVNQSVPEAYSVLYGYNDLGQVNALSVQEAGNQPVPIITNVSYSPVGQIKSMSYANGIATENIYDPLQAYRLTGKKTRLNNQLFQRLNYAYDNVGNITQLIDTSETLTAKTTAYDYDDLNRLTRAVVTNSANHEDYVQYYAYDPIGNITNKSDIGAYLYENANPYQASSINNQAYSYDANGNLARDFIQNYSYNYNDRLMAATSLDELTASYFAYDQSGQRTYKRVETSQGIQTTITETVYPNTHLEFEYLNEDYQNSVSITKHLFLGNQRIGQVKSQDTANTTSLIFSDHLGSSSIMTDINGNITATYDYYPYGGTRIEEEVAGETMALLQESMYAVMGMMGGKGSNGKAFNSLDDVFAEAAKHAKEMGTHKKNKINLCQSIRVQLEL